MKKLIIAICISTLFSMSVIAQNYRLNEYDLEIIQVLQKKKVGGTFLSKGEKFVGVEIILTPKSTKNNGLYSLAPY